MEDREIRNFWDTRLWEFWRSVVAALDDTLRLTLRGCRGAIKKGGRRRMPRHCLTLDLKDDETAIAEYKRYHVKIWPEVKQSLFDAGVVEMEIYLLGTRLFMIMDVDNSFSLSAKAAKDLANAKVQEWETIMHGFQQQLRGARADQYWMVMERVFSLDEQ
jgi:L-rhamnose mutarotase